MLFAKIIKISPRLSKLQLAKIGAFLLIHSMVTAEIFLLYRFNFLPRDAMRKRGLCCGPVSVRLSVSRSCILFRRLKISSNFIVGPVAPSV